jgi:invasion protein IalB
MHHRIRFAPTRVLGPVCAAALAVVALVCDVAAQTPKAAPTTAPPQQQPASPAPQTIYSSWTKFCEKGPQPTDKQVCLTSQYGQNEAGATVVVATLIELEGGKKALRITLPLGVQLHEGMQAVVDQGQPINALYSVCGSNGCSADIQASDDLIDELKAGKGLMVQGVNFDGYVLSYALPLDTFAKAYDGAPVTAEELEQQRKLQEDLARRAAEARKRVEGEQPKK